MEYLELPIFSTGEIMKIGIKNILYRKKSDFQEISVIDTIDYGKCLVIDGIVQAAESDHESYDRTLLRKLSKKDKNILILGGGDGYVAQMALALNPEAKITVADLDVEVIKACQKYLDQKIFEHPNVSLEIGDALHFMESHGKQCKMKFDGVICDLTDNPEGGQGSEEAFKDFFCKIFKLSKNIMKDGAWISVQAGSSKTSAKYVDSAKILFDLLNKDFQDVSQENLLIPSFGEECTFLFARK